MEINISGVLTKDEYLHALKLSNHCISKRSLIRIDLWILFFLTGTALIATGIWVFPSNQEASLIGSVLILFGLFLNIVAFKIREAPIKLWEQNDLFRIRREGVVTENYIQIHTPSSQTKFLWSDFNGYGEYQDVVVLYQGTVIAHPYSARFFQSEAAWNQFKSIVTEKLQLTHRVNEFKRENLFVYLLILIAVITILFEILTPK